MTFATDRDLLVVEPTLFRDAAFASQTLVQTSDASVASGTLTSAAADFTAAGVDVGAVVMVAGTPLEVLARLSTTQLTVSRLRESTVDAAIAPAPATAAQLTISTFLPQIRVIHDMLLRAIGVDPADPGAAVTEASVTNPSAFRRAEALGALHLIFAAAAPMVRDDSPLWAKAELHRMRFASERRRLVAGIDLDGDGLPDAARRINVIQLIRA